jgi:MoaA/NifB/PqqE/SkfB family radical SAM enzyme
MIGINDDKLILRERQLGIQILNKCSLNCKLCGTYTQEYKRFGIKYISSIDEIMREIDAIFTLYDFIDDITVTGGEPLLHKNLDKILFYLLKYQNQYSVSRVFTNGTIIPGKNIIDMLKKFQAKLQIVVNHYGELSKHTEDIKNISIEYGFNVRINDYSKGNPYSGGWVDFGPLSEYRAYTDMDVIKQFTNCHEANWKCLIVYKGQLHLCPASLHGSLFKHFKSKEDEFIDLFDNSVSFEKKRQIAAGLGKKVITACQYCNGFDIKNSRRVAPAEQV